jgi:hypothetical protein
MTNGLNGLGDGTTSREEQMALQQIAIANAGILQFAIPHAPPQELVGRLVQAFVTQPDLAEEVLSIVADPDARVSHPVWGVKIVRTSDEFMLAHVHARKVLDPNSPTYAAELGNWLLILAYVTTPACRVAWGPLGVRVEFYQAKDDTQKPALPEVTGG